MSPSAPEVTSSRSRTLTGVVQVVEAFGDPARGGLGSGLHRAGLFGVAGQRLLAEDVLARLQRGYVPLGVRRVDQGVVDQVHVGIGDHVSVGAVHLSDAPFGGERLGTGPVTGGDGHELMAQRPRRIDNALISDPGGAQDADTQRRRHMITSGGHSTTDRILATARP